MSAGTIYTVGSDGGLARMRPGAPASEDEIQELIARHPDLIGDDDGKLLLIRREHLVSDATNGSSRWSVDHLFVTRNAVPVLVEVKRAKDTRARREVVGQMLDYAANSVAYWPAGSIAGAFAATAGANMDADGRLAEFLGGDDPDTFWAQVDANAAAGRLKLVFVADAIPPELARIVEFLNEQMRADVRAVELKWFASDFGDTALVPRVIGETARPKPPIVASMPAVSAEAWVVEQIGSYGKDAVSGAHAFLEMMHELGGDVVVGGGQASLQAKFRTRPGQTVGLLSLWSAGAKIELPFGYIKNRPGLVEEKMRQKIYDLFMRAVGNLSTNNLQGFPAFAVAALAQVERRDAVMEAARALVNAAVE